MENETREIHAHLILSVDTKIVGDDTVKSILERLELLIYMEYLSAEEVHLVEVSPDSVL